MSHKIPTETDTVNVARLRSKAIAIAPVQNCQVGNSAGYVPSCGAKKYVSLRYLSRIRNTRPVKQLTIDTPASLRNGICNSIGQTPDSSGTSSVKLPSISNLTASITSPSRNSQDSLPFPLPPGSQTSSTRYPVEQTVYQDPFSRRSSRQPSLPDLQAKQEVHLPPLSSILSAPVAPQPHPHAASLPRQEVYPPQYDALNTYYAAPQQRHQSFASYSPDTSHLGYDSSLDKREQSPDSSTESRDKRKRVVRKRTRTGCLTCRRRRIKCDERKPFCFNCEKSKRVCAGYEQVPYGARRYRYMSQPKPQEAHIEHGDIMQSPTSGTLPPVMHSPMAPPTLSAAMMPRSPPQTAFPMVRHHSHPSPQVQRSPVLLYQPYVGNPPPYAPHYVSRSMAYSHYTGHPGFTHPPR
ncbi:hypothetical protein KL951_003931 [Ogataea haglerorum]|nr:hypothetical protein KL951_003931 [Ogataea haglerorum]